MTEEDNLALSLVCQLSPGTTVEAASERPPKAGGERARRQTMSRLYAELGALLPQPPATGEFALLASTTQIVEEAIECVKELREKKAELEAYRAVAAGRTTRDGRDGAEVVASGTTSCFAVRLLAARPGALTRVLEVFQRHGVVVLAATVARNGEETAFTVTTAAVAPRVLDTIKAEIICTA